MKNKNLLIIVFEIFVIVLGIVGITYATSVLINNRTSTLLTASGYNIDYVGDSDIVINGLEPMDDNLVNYSTKNNVIRLEFSLRGVKENNKEDLIYDVMMKDMNVDCGLLNKYTKWRLFKNGSLISNGSLDPSFDGDILGENMHLTNIQEDLPKYNEDYDKYVLLFWISESCDNLETCELVDQSSILNSQMSMKVFIALYSGAKKPLERIGNNDNTCANRPILADNMVPVTYNNGEFVVADSTNHDENYLWYDYFNQKWANAIVVKNNKYATVGMKINPDDILGYFVWIPRFRYKLWNVNPNVTDSYNAYDDGINIIFENGLGKTENNNSNDSYLTHPAFGNDLRGFWISKYEISKENDEYKFLDNIESYKDDSIENYQMIAESLSNSYKLNEKTTSHMITNLEWGATLYLSHSSYGVCKGDGCTSIGINNNYVSGANKEDTTTRNVYGVYDMAGASPEYVLGNEKIGTATDEVTLENGDTWYEGHAISSERNYLVRGGANKGLFYFGDISMDTPSISTRVVLTIK